MCFSIDLMNGDAVAAKMDHCLGVAKAAGITAVAAVAFFAASKGLESLTKSRAMSYLQLSATTNPWVNFGGGLIAATGIVHGLTKMGSTEKA